jgi:hypothetical protein
MPEANWEPYLENRCHLPYHSLDGMRRCAKPVAKLTCSEGDEVLWQLSLDCYKPERNTKFDAGNLDRNPPRDDAFIFHPFLRR